MGMTHLSQAAALTKRNVRLVRTPFYDLGAKKNKG